jgi:hypothetical protein
MIYLQDNKKEARNSEHFYLRSDLFLVLILSVPFNHHNSN